MALREAASVALALPVAACSLLVQTDGLSGGVAPEAVHGAAADAGAAIPSNVTGASRDAGAAAAAGDTPPLPIKLVSPPVTSPYVDAAAGGQASVTTTTEVGSLLVVGVAWTYGTSSGTPPTMTVFDANGGAWKAATAAYDNDQLGGGVHCKADVQLFFATNAKGGDDLVTVVSSQPDNTSFAFTLLQYRGIATDPGTSPLDDFTGQIAPLDGSNLLGTPPLTLTAAEDVIVGVFIDTAGGGQMTPGEGFTLRGANTGLYSMVEDNAPGGIGPRSRTVTARLPGTQTDNCWASAAAAFRAR